MKLLVAVVLGMILGVLGTLAYDDPKSVARTAHKLINKGEEQVKDTKFNNCRTQFLEETSCFQKKKPEECLKDIDAKCGPLQKPE